MAGNENGGPAFPCNAAGGCGPWDGMTLRDWFAGQALFAIVVVNDDGGPLKYRPDNAAVDAYLYADAMLAERIKGV